MQQNLEATYRAIVENTSDGALGLNHKGVVCLANWAATELLGYSEAEIVGISVEQLIELASRDLFDEMLSSRLRLPDNDGLVRKGILSLNGLHHAGHAVPFEASILPCGDASEIRAIVLLRSLGHRARMTDTIQAVKDSYSALSETTTDAIIQISARLRIIYANKAATEMFGREELANQDLSILFPLAAYARYSELFSKYFLIDDTHRSQSRLSNILEVLGRNIAGEAFPIEISIGNSRNVLGERVITCIIRDISDRKRTERKLKFLAYHDKLTELGNRDLLYESLRQYLSQGPYPEGSGALMFLDLDGFKKINDTLGHEAGDKILREASRRLAHCLRESDRLYRFSEETTVKSGTHEELFRFGGDEFVIFLARLGEPADAAKVAQRILNAVSAPYQTGQEDGGGKSEMGVSIGIALVPENGTDVMELIRNADVAMYKAKETRNSYVFFSAEISERANQRLELEISIREALEKGMFRLHYQPLVDSKGNIQGAEALLRMDDREGAPVSPALFIPIAEEIGLVAQIGDWVFRTACGQLGEWNAKGHPGFFMSVNLSVKQFNQSDLVDRLTTIIRDARIDPANLRIEVTESCLVEDPAEARRKMDEIKEQNPGILIAIDDFGAGYSSLSYLSVLPVDVVKIDQSFVMNLYTQRHNPKIVNTILALADSLHISTIAEGVETEEQLHYLATKQCKHFQGYYFSKPVAAEQFAQFLDRGRP